MTDVNFPSLAPELRERLLAPPKQPIRMVLDTDTYNEIDDQFALVYALLAPEKLTVEAIYAAPFHNDRSTGPADGMRKSYEEILRLLERLNVSPEGLVFEGSTEYLSQRTEPEPSPAALDLIAKARASSSDDPLYVVAIGAITNVASALLLAPDIIDRVVVVWLGGNPTHLPWPGEFNLQQDPRATRLVFDSGVPLVQIPCLGVASHLLTTKGELAENIAGRNPISDFLYQRFCEYSDDHFAWAKEIWDISAIAYLIDDSWVPSMLIDSPLMTDDLRYHPAAGRHPIRAAFFIRRNPIFQDLFRRLQNVK